MSLIDDVDINDDDNNNITNNNVNNTESLRKPSLFRTISSIRTSDEDYLDSKDLFSSTQCFEPSQQWQFSEPSKRVPSCSSSSSFYDPTSEVHDPKPFLIERKRQQVLNIFGGVSDDLETQYENIYRSIPMSAKERMINLLCRRDFLIKRHYVPFRYNHFFPIGCTNTHAFGVIKKRSDGGFYPISLCFTNFLLEEPSEAYAKSKPFVSPWKQRLEGFDSYLGGCAYLSYLCVITHTAVAVLNADWLLIMVDNRVRFEKITCCTMNHEFLVIVGKIKNQDRIIIYRWYYSNEIVIQKNMTTEIISVKLVVEDRNTVLYVNIQKNEGYTSVHPIKDNQQGELGSFIVLNNEDASTSSSSSSSFSWSSSSFLSSSEFDQTSKKRWSFGMNHRFTLLLKEPETVMFSKMLQDGCVLQFTKKGIFSCHGTTISNFSKMASTPIDAVLYGHGIYAAHGMDNTLRFYDMFKKEISVLGRENILAPMIILQREIPAIKYYYDSIALFSDKKSIALLLPYGCLCVITPRN
jgi:hypothetical protein